ncbi:MAG: prepilin peptidase [Pseudonocardiaceae bacterium]
MDIARIVVTGAFAVLLLLLAVRDIQARVIPNRVVYPGAALALAAAPLLPAGTHLSALTGGAIALAVFIAIYLVRPDAMGEGDVKLAGVIGLGLGFPNALVALFLGAVFGGLVAGAGLALRRASLRSTMAYGPYLCAGALAVALLGRGPLG